MPRFITFTPNPALDIATSVDQLVDAHKLRCDAPQVHPGGGGINVARVLHRLGADVLALYTAGGSTGARVHALLQAEGVPDQALAVAADTRESFTVHERSSGREYRFVLPGPSLSAAEWQACLQQLAQFDPSPRRRVVPAGEGVSYGATDAAPHDRVIATLPIGYADGIPRALSNGVGRAYANGQFMPIVGRVCMDMLMVDATGVWLGDPAARLGGSTMKLVPSRGTHLLFERSVVGRSSRGEGTIGLTARGHDERDRRQHRQCGDAEHEEAVHDDGHGGFQPQSASC